MVKHKDLLQQGWQMFTATDSDDKLFLLREDDRNIVRIKLSDGREGEVSLEYADQFTELIDTDCPTCGRGTLETICVDLNLRLQLACTRCHKLHIPVGGDAVLCVD